MAMKLMQAFLDEMEDDEIVKCVQGSSINHFENFRIDRQGALVKGPPDYWRVAVQPNDQAQATVLKNLTRTRPGGGSYNKSKPVFAQFLSEVDTVATAKTVREAFYASIVIEMLPEKLGKWWHGVKIDKAGNIFVTQCPEYVAWLAQETEKEEKQKKKQEKKKPVGKKAQAKSKGFDKGPNKDKGIA